MEHRLLTEPETIFEDRDFIVLNKPAGWQVHPARHAGPAKKIAPTPILTDWLLARYPEIKNVGDDPETRPGIVHRLDKETSGIMLVARTAEAFAYLKSLFQEREIKKTYLAVVRGIPKEKEGVIDAPIGVRSGTLKRSIHATTMVKPAVTEYRTKKIFEKEGDPDFSLLEVLPRTGRTHQIRVHLASIGCPIIGDHLYGRKLTGKKGESLRDTRLMLHALSLEFTTRQGRRMKFEADPPSDFQSLIHS